MAQQQHGILFFKTHFLDLLCAVLREKNVAKA